ATAALGAGSVGRGARRADVRARKRGRQVVASLVRTALGRVPARLVALEARATGPRGPAQGGRVRVEGHSGERPEAAGRSGSALARRARCGAAGGGAHHGGAGPGATVAVRLARRASDCLAERGRSPEPLRQDAVVAASARREA